jgi:hypothetical protein
VRVKQGKDKNKIEIEFQTEAELERLYNALTGGSSREVEETAE